MLAITLINTEIRQSDEEGEARKLVSNLLFISFYYIKKFRAEGKKISVYVFVLKNVFGNIKFVKTAAAHSAASRGRRKEVKMVREKKLQQKCPIIFSFLITY